MAVFDKNGKEADYAFDVHDGRWHNTETLEYIEDDEAEALGLHEKFTKQEMKNLAKGFAIFLAILLASFLYLGAKQ